ncbi:hypothetical protein GQ600_7364 [Phytophthora cactorum]|nr:hypothetical protein GQ600_7364 [Phytophthora cactorum]
MEEQPFGALVATASLSFTQKHCCGVCFRISEMLVGTEHGILGLAFSVDDSTADVLCVFCGMIRPGA